MEQNKTVDQSKNRIRNVAKTLKNIVGYDEAIDALILALVARKDVALVGPRGTAFAYLVSTLAGLVQARLVTATSTEEWSLEDDKFDFLRRLAFFKIKPNIALPPRLIEKKNAWILIIATDEEAFKGKEAVLYDGLVKAFVRHLDSRDLVSAVEARWLHRYAPIASMEDVRVLHEYAVSLLKKEEIIKSYIENMVPLVEKLRIKRIAVGDEHVIEMLVELYAAYLAVHGLSPENMISAACEVLPYIAQSQEELDSIKKAIDETLGDVAGLIRLLNDGKQLLEIGDVKTALEVFHEVATYDINHLPQDLKKKAEVLISTSSKFIAEITKNKNL